VTIGKPSNINYVFLEINIKIMIAFDFIELFRWQLCAHGAPYTGLLIAGSLSSYDDVADWAGK
jgi:hypothetical protein